MFRKRRKLAAAAQQAAANKPPRPMRSSANGSSRPQLSSWNSQPTRPTEQAPRDSRPTPRRLPRRRLSEGDILQEIERSLIPRLNCVVVDKLCSETYDSDDTSPTILAARRCTCRQDSTDNPGKLGSLCHQMNTSLPRVPGMISNSSRLRCQFCESHHSLGSQWRLQKDDIVKDPVFQRSVQSKRWSTGSKLGSKELLCAARVQERACSPPRSAWGVLLLIIMVVMGLGALAIMYSRLLHGQPQAVSLALPVMLAEPRLSSELWEECLPSSCSLLPWKSSSSGLGSDPVALVTFSATIMEGSRTGQLAVDAFKAQLAQYLHLPASQLVLLSKVNMSRRLLALDAPLELEAAIFENDMPHAHELVNILGSDWIAPAHHSVSHAILSGMRVWVPKKSRARE